MKLFSETTKYLNAVDKLCAWVHFVLLYDAKFGEMLDFLWIKTFLLQRP